MERFKKTINGIEFEFQGITEGPEEVCRVSVENQQFKMTTDEEGNWQILQQVPKWVKELEVPLGEAIDEAYN
ncbi:MAG TPA: hypothetical protein VM368_08430 [Flavisolibacter sp.]|nr:hypothetical protein [Flavisolibacter sp.]